MLRVQTALGDTTGAEALLEQLAAGAHGAAVPLFEPAVAALRVQRAGAPAAAVADWMERFEGRGQDQTLLSLPITGYCPPDMESFEIAIWARLRLAQGQAEQVVSRLERFLESMVKQGRHGAAMTVRVFLAALYWRSHRRERAAAVLEPALALAEREGYVRVFLEAGGALIPVLRYCVEQRIHPEQSGKLLGAFGEAVVAAGESPEAPGLSLTEPLSERQLEVLRLAAAGLSNETIAARLFVSPGTVKGHLHQIYGKLDVTGRFSAVTRARELGLL
jgi:LuxR family maltose regulon positive regulatory protein